MLYGVLVYWDYGRIFGGAGAGPEDRERPAWRRSAPKAFMRAIMDSK
jgi:hypothetical protein